jgi:hypothetical protein
MNNEQEFKNKLLTEYSFSYLTGLGVVYCRYKSVIADLYLVLQS